jgi:hypothetical protein
VVFEDRVIEVEGYVDGANMDIGAGLEHGMCALGRIHAVLAAIDVPAPAIEAPFPNHVEAERALAWTRSGTATIRTGRPSVDDLRIADVADTLATELADAEIGTRGSLPRTVLCFVGMLAFIQAREARRRLMGEIAPDLVWSLDLVRRAEVWQHGFAT